MHAESQRTGIPVDDLVGAAREAAPQPGVSRRDAVRAAGLLAAGGVVAAATARPAPARAAEPDVVVVGAGLAGLRAAHWLWKVKGIAATVYEGSTRARWALLVAARPLRQRPAVEHGGALINTDHNAIRGLVQNLGLNLRDVRRRQPAA